MLTLGRALAHFGFDEFLSLLACHPKRGDVHPTTKIYLANFVKHNRGRLTVFIKALSMFCQRAAS